MIKKLSSIQRIIPFLHFRNYINDIINNQWNRLKRAYIDKIDIKSYLVYINTITVKIK